MYMPASATPATARNPSAGSRLSHSATGYYNLSHPYQGFAILPPDEAERDLVWNAAVGIRKPDDQLLVAIDAALDRLRADGTVETIYANYGIPLLPAR
jgi:polar amino acid transport system substrate-binding protein